MNVQKKSLICTFFALSTFFSCSSDSYDSNDTGFQLAHENGILAREGFERCRRFVYGWLEHADPETGLIPKNIGKNKIDSVDVK